MKIKGMKLSCHRVTCLIPTVCIMTNDKNTSPGTSNKFDALWILICLRKWKSIAFLMPNSWKLFVRNSEKISCRKPNLILWNNVSPWAVLAICNGAHIIKHGMSKIICLWRDIKRKTTNFGKFIRSKLRWSKFFYLCFWAFSRFKYDGILIGDYNKRRL